MFGLGGKEVVIIVLVIFFLFSAQRIPKMTKSFLDAIRSVIGAFKQSSGNSLKSLGNKR